jgi:hypothetical protein
MTAVDTSIRGVPDWLADSPDEREELVALGILEAADVGQLKAIADYDALASKWLRAKARVLYDREQRQAALERELRQVRELYQAEFSRLERREGFIDETLALISRAAPIPGGKKSRTVGFGTYGMKSKPAAVAIEDPVALGAWAREHLPAACRVSLRLDYAFVRDHLPDKLVTETGAPRALEIITTPLIEHVEATGEEMPGARYVPKHDEPYFKPATVAWQDHA